MLSKPVRHGGRKRLITSTPRSEKHDFADVPHRQARLDGHATPCVSNTPGTISTRPAFPQPQKNKQNLKPLCPKTYSHAIKLVIRHHGILRHQPGSSTPITMWVTFVTLATNWTTQQKKKGGRGGTGCNVGARTDHPAHQCKPGTCVDTDATPPGAVLEALPIHLGTGKISARHAHTNTSVNITKSTAKVRFRKPLTLACSGLMLQLCEHGM